MKGFAKHEDTLDYGILHLIGKSNLTENEDYRSSDSFSLFLKLNIIAKIKSKIYNYNINFKEKDMKSKKILLIIIVIILMVIFLWIKNYQKEANIENELEEKTIVDMNNNITEVNIVTNINNLTNPKIEEIAKNTLNEYIEKISHYEKSSIGPMPYLLSNLGFTSVEELNEMCTDVYSSTDYIKSNVKYSDFKNALLQYITEDYFLKYFSQYKNIDGYVAFCNCAGASGTSSVEKVKLMYVRVIKLVGIRWIYLIILIWILRRRS